MNNLEVPYSKYYPEGAIHFTVDAGGTLYYKRGVNNIWLYYDQNGDWVPSSTGLEFFDINPKPISELTNYLMGGEVNMEVLPPWKNVKEFNLKEGDQYVCWYQGLPVVLELGLETPSYEETFKPFLYWFEPHHDMMVIDFPDIEWVIPAPTDPVTHSPDAPQETVWLGEESGMAIDYLRD